MDVRDLEMFEAVARHQHISRAAAELLIAQPALSRQIRLLEQELGGVKLLSRAGRGVQLTEAGRTLHEHAIKILAEMRTMQAEMAEHAGALRGRVAIGTPPTVGLRLLPDLLADYHRLHPGVELHIRENSSRELVQLLNDGLIDMAIISLPAPSRDLDAIFLFEEELKIVLASNHPLATRSSVAFSELADLPFLLYPPGYEIRETTLGACRRAGFVPRIVLDGGEINMLLRLAEVGLGLALMPPLALVGTERLALLTVTDQPLRRVMGLVTHRDRALAPTALSMRHFLTERLADNQRIGSAHPH